MSRTISLCRIEVSPREVDAGANLTLRGHVSSAADLQGQSVLIEDHDGGLVETIELTGFDGESNETGEVVVKAPVRPGTHVWRAVWPAQTLRSVSHADESTSFSFTVKPHPTRVVVWDGPSTVERGKSFGIKLGVKCLAECHPKGWAVDVSDHEGQRQATATLSDAPWPGTAALYYAEVDLMAPDAEGLFSWEARAPGRGAEVPHAEGTARFGVRVVPPPECRVTVVAVDAERHTTDQWCQGRDAPLHRGDRRARRGRDQGSQGRLPAVRLRIEPRPFPTGWRDDDRRDDQGGAGIGRGNLGRRYLVVSRDP